MNPLTREAEPQFDVYPLRLNTQAYAGVVAAAIVNSRHGGIY